MLQKDSPGFRNFEVPVHLIMITDGMTVDQDGLVFELGHPVWKKASDHPNHITRTVVGVGFSFNHLPVNILNKLAGVSPPETMGDTDAGQGGGGGALQVDPTLHDPIFVACVGPGRSSGIQHLKTAVGALDATEGYAPCSTTPTTTATTTATSTATSTVTSTPGLCSYDPADLIIVQDGTTDAVKGFISELTRLLPEKNDAIRPAQQYTVTKKFSLADALTAASASLSGRMEPGIPPGRRKRRDGNGDGDGGGAVVCRGRVLLDTSAERSLRCNCEADCYECMVDAAAIAANANAVPVGTVCTICKNEQALEVVAAAAASSADGSRLCIPPESCRYGTTGTGQCIQLLLHPLSRIGAHTRLVI